MELFDKKITVQWWEELLKDETKLITWLKKLQVTEIDGYKGNFEANAKWNLEGNRIYERFFIETARDERNHSTYLKQLLIARGHAPLKNQTPTSIYWEKMEEKVTSLREMCAVFYLGERLASERFLVIADHKGTPEDIMGFLDTALPDEQMHAVGYKQLAGELAISKMLQVHHKVMPLIMGRRL